ncbi:MAG: hypothetical protein JXN65_03180 [Clostridia bacterium]|nr:hypothetical protein [Clostridia bacterium]
MQVMGAWWDALSSLQHFFYFIAVPATVVLFIQFILSVIGLAGDHDVDTGGADADVDVDMDGDLDGGMDGHFDGHIDGHADAGNFHADGTDAETADFGHMDFRFVSFRTIIAFLTVFPWTGIALLEKIDSIPLVIIISVLAGLAAMFVIGYLFYITARLQSSGNINYKNAIGQTAEVYIPLLKENNYQGKVQVVIQDRLVEATAISGDSKNHSTGEMVKVVGVVGLTTLVIESNK